MLPLLIFVVKQRMSPCMHRVHAHMDSLCAWTLPCYGCKYQDVGGKETEESGSMLCDLQVEGLQGCLLQIIPLRNKNIMQNPIDQVNTNRRQDKIESKQTEPTQEAKLGAQSPWSTSQGLVQIMDPNKFSLNKTKSVQIGT